ncbi:cupin domain-containing protein [Gordonia sp. PP30]|uniref:cupin domain-containing protein n=1 Tax=Gordonia sp. PP30 TaxID=2935861 RepID=UPI00200052B1|nr:cupin domain-containing protein [Gordonia sp. PP30]UQE76398.1 cupin domain-containing protein [Gordonia sp. PP30]
MTQRELSGLVGDRLAEARTARNLSLSAIAAENDGPPAAPETETAGAGASHRPGPRISALTSGLTAVTGRVSRLLGHGSAGAELTVTEGRVRVVADDARGEVFGEGDAFRVDPGARYTVESLDERPAVVVIRRPGAAATAPGRPKPGAREGT